MSTGERLQIQERFARVLDGQQPMVLARFAEIGERPLRGSDSDPAHATHACPARGARERVGGTGDRGWGGQRRVGPVTHL